jgi:hypothetical protein
MQQQGVKSVYILNDKEAYGLGVAKNSEGGASARDQGLGFSAYDPKQRTSRRCSRRSRARSRTPIFIGGLIDENSGQLINDKVRARPEPNNSAARRHALAPGRLHDRRRSSSAQGGTPNANGAYFSVAGRRIDKYKGAALSSSTASRRR